jgi:FlaA1/EpsC-like NDP-sugar epimerase
MKRTKPYRQVKKTFLGADEFEPARRLYVIEGKKNPPEPTKERVMNIRNKTVLITGANRGIGRALVQEALRRGAKRVYAER